MLVKSILEIWHSTLQLQLKPKALICLVHFVSNHYKSTNFHAFCLIYLVKEESPAGGASKACRDEFRPVGERRVTAGTGEEARPAQMVEEDAAHGAKQEGCGLWRGPWLISTRYLLVVSGCRENIQNYIPGYIWLEIWIHCICKLILKHIFLALIKQRWNNWLLLFQTLSYTAVYPINDIYPQTNSVTHSGIKPYPPQPSKTS